MPRGGGDIYREPKRRGIYLAPFTNPEGDSCFSIYQISWIKIKKGIFSKLEKSLTRKLVLQFTNISGIFVKYIKIIFYLQVNTDKPKIILFRKCSKRDAILTPVAKQWIAKDIPSYGSQSKREKIAIHWFGEY